MINIHNQTEIDKNYLIARFDPNRAIYGTDGVKLFINEATGKIYRCVDTVANIAGATDLTNTNHFVSVDVIHNQDGFNQDIGTVKVGLTLKTTADLKLNHLLGTLKVYNHGIMGYEGYSIGAGNGVTFDYILADGTIVDGGVTDIDTDNYNNTGTKTALSRTTHATFQKVYIKTDGTVQVLRGDIEYNSLNQANYKHISEEVPNLSTLGLYYIGGILITKNCTDMTNFTRARLVYSSKICESQVGAGGSLLALLKDPIADLTALKALESPENGEVRQDLSFLPKVTLWAFNTSASTGESADDGTSGFWNQLEAVSSRELETKNADFTADENTDYVIDSTGGAITVTIPDGTALTKGKIISFKKSDTSNNAISLVNSGVTLYGLTVQHQSVEILLLDGEARILSEYHPLGTFVNRADVGRFVFQLPNPSLGIYPLDGSTITDKLLAEHISNNIAEYDGFTVNGIDITLPDFRGEILYGAGGRGLDTKQGIAVGQDIQSHRHSIGESYNTSGGGYVYESGSSRDATYCKTDYYGGTYTRAYGRTATLCILGTTYFKLDSNSTIATTISVSFTGQTVDGGDTAKTIYEGVHRFIVKVDLPFGKELDTVTNAVIDDRKNGYISFWRSAGGGDFTVDIAVRDIVIIDNFKIFDDGTEALFMPLNGVLSLYNDFTVDRVDWGYTDNYHSFPFSGFGENWAGIENRPNERILFSDGGIDIDKKNFEISCWVKVTVIQDSNYFIGNGNTSTAHETIHIGFSNSTTFKVGFYGADVDYSGINQDDFKDKYTHIFISHDSTNRLTDLFINGVSQGELTHSAQYENSITQLLGARNTNKHFRGGISAIRINKNTDYSIRGARCATIIDFDKKMIGES